MNEPLYRGPAGAAPLRVSRLIWGLWLPWLLMLFALKPRYAPWNLDAVSWLGTGAAALIAAGRFKSELEKRSSRVLKKYRVGSLVFTWNHFRLLAATRDEAVRSDQHLNEYGARVRALIIAPVIAFVWLVVVSTARGR